jgi:hypothetical protein
LEGIRTTASPKSNRAKGDISFTGCNMAEKRHFLLEQGLDNDHSDG